MKSEFNYPKFSVRLSRSGAVVIIRDELGQSILLNTNLLKHALGVPYRKKDGSFVTAQAIRKQVAGSSNRPVPRR